MSRLFQLTTLWIALCASCSTPPVAEPVIWRPDTLEANGWERDSDLLHVALDLTISFDDKRVAGSATNWVRALRPGTSAIRLHAVGLAIERIEDSAGRTLAFTLDEPWLDIELAEALDVGREESLTIHYAAQPTSGLHFVDASAAGAEPEPQVWSLGQFEENRRWIPTWDYPNDRATFEAKLRVDEGMYAVSNGELVKTEDHLGGERTFYWRMESDMATYLIAIAAGRWELYEDDWNGVPLQYFVAPGTGEEAVQRAFGETPEMMAFFSELLDAPYPYPKYAQIAVQDYPFGGMENTTATIYDDRIIGTQGEIDDLDGDPRLLVAHELAHHWFGDLVTCLGWSHLWLNEAWASYLELQFEKKKSGSDPFVLWLERYRGRFIAAGQQARNPLALDWFSQGHGERANHVYYKGPWVLYMIHNALGDDAFWRAVRAYVARHAGGLVTTGDFVRAVFDSTGRNIEQLVEQWVEGGGYPVYAVSFNAKDATRGNGPLKLTITQAQDSAPPVPLFDMPVAVDLHFVNGKVIRHVLAVRKQVETFELPLEGELVDIVIDPDCKLLCGLEFDKGIPMWLHQGELEGQIGARWRAIEALRTSAPLNPTVQEFILNVLRNDPEPLMRQHAARCSDFPQAAPILVLAVLRDEEPRVRLQAMDTLAQLYLTDRQRALLELHLDTETSPGVIRRIRDLIGLD